MYIVYGRDKNQLRQRNTDNALQNSEIIKIILCKRKVFIWLSQTVRWQAYTVKPVLSDHSKVDKTKVYKTDGSLMQVESNAECSYGAFCNTL